MHMCWVFHCRRHSHSLPCSSRPSTHTHTHAARLADDTKSEPLSDMHIFVQAQRVIESLKAHDCSAALAWCEANRARLKKVKSSLEFKLRLQEFLELVAKVGGGVGGGRGMGRRGRCAVCVVALALPCITCIMHCECAGCVTQKTGGVPWLASNPVLLTF